MIWKLVKAFLSPLEVDVIVVGDLLTLKVRYAGRTLIDRSVDFIPDGVKQISTKGVPK